MAGPRCAEYPRKFEQHGDTARIVVGSRMNLTDLGHAYTRAAATEVIVVGGDDNDFIGEARIVARQYADHVAQLEWLSGP